MAIFIECVSYSKPPAYEVFGIRRYGISTIFHKIAARYVTQDFICHAMGRDERRIGYPDLFIVEISRIEMSEKKNTR